MITYKPTMNEVYLDAMDDISDLADLLGGLAVHSKTEHRIITLRYALKNLEFVSSCVREYLEAATGETSNGQDSEEEFVS